MSTTPETTITGPLKRWLDTLPKTMPLSAVKHPVEEHALTVLMSEAKLASDSLLTAVLWLRIGEIDHSHAIVQNDSSPLGSYLHGVVHRLEQDFWNSKYWFKQVREPSLLSSVSRFMSEFLTENGMTEPAFKMGIFAGSQFQPAQFVSACEPASGNSKLSKGDRDLLECVGYAEWLALWKIVNFD
jgi:hypothetical protein